MKLFLWNSEQIMIKIHSEKQRHQNPRIYDILYSFNWLHKRQFEEDKSEKKHEKTATGKKKP